MHISVRASHSKDSDKLERLIKDAKTKYFGYLPLHMKAEEFYMGYQSHRFIAYEKGNTDSILAYAEIRSFPNICALLPQCWTDWLNHHYCIDLPITMVNTLFFNLFIFKNNDPEVLPFILREVFLCENRLRYLITVKPPMKCNEGQFMDYNILEKYTISYYPIQMSMETNRNTQMVYIALRDSILPYISFRKALPEDNDDIIDIIDYEEPELRNELGDYFIAEELLRQDEEAKMQCIIVGEVAGKNAAILNAGFMWLSDDFKIETLIRNFHIETFGNLLLCDPKKPYKEYQELVKISVPKPYTKLFTKLAIRELTDSVIMGGSAKYGSIAVVQSNAFFKVFVSDCGDMQTSNEAFFQRRHMFEKFQYIYEEFLHPRHYVIPRKEVINVCFNVPWKEDANDLIAQDAVNFFILNKFNLHPKQRMETTFCFLSATFSAFPDRDYLLVRLRPEMRVNECLNEILHYCLRITPRPDCKIPYELYLTHRSSLFGEICLFDYCEYDTTDIERLMDVDTTYRKTLTKQSIDTLPVIDPRAELYKQMGVIYEIMEDVLTRSCGSKFRFFTIRCGNSSKSREETTFIGFVVIREMTCYSELGQQFMLATDKLHFGELRAEIVILKLHPFFHVLNDELFRMLATKTGYFDFYHITKFSGSSMPNDLKKNMMPIEPRRIRRHWFGLSPRKPRLRDDYDAFGLPYIDATQDRLALFRHSLLPTSFYGNKDTIVIIGFSDYAKCFLRCLIFSWNGYSSDLTSLYNCVPLLNVTVIVNDGVVESAYDNEFSCDYCDTIRYCYISNSHFSPYVQDCTHRIDLRNWVHFVSGRVEFIDRANRTVNLSNKCRIRYDKLLLMCHTEFGIDVPDVNDKLHYPYNYSQLNSRLDRIILYHKIQELCENHSEQPLILLYGNNISTFACIQFLLTHGVGPEWIELVKPRCKLPEKVMTDSKSDESVQNICTEMIIDIGVKVIEEATFVKCILYPEDENFISHVRFQFDKNDEFIDLQCDIFINFNEDYLLNANHTMLLKSGIKLRDKKIIIDENYCTNDPRIYAMGRFMEMKREPSYQYLNTNQMEAAEKLMYILGIKFHKDVNNPFDRKYSKTYVFRARLPNNYQFFKVTIPRRFISPEATPTGAQCSHKNQYSYFLEFLCGKHEALLNNILYRFESGVLSDFVEFFNEPWTELFMHDMFDQLQAQNIETIKELIKIHAIDTIEEVDGKSLEQRQEDFINEKSKFLENNLIQFIKHYQRDFVNDFALPQEIQI